MPDQPTKPPFRHLAYAIAGLAILFFIGSWNLPLEPGKCPDQETQHNPPEDHCSQNQPPTLGLRTQALVADIWDIGAKHHGFEFLIAAFTLALAAFTCTLWRATLRLVNHTPQIERAYLSGDGISTFTPVDRSEPQSRIRTTEFQFRVSNHGKTPGILTRYAVAFCDALNIPETPDYTDMRHCHEWIGPAVLDHPITVFVVPPEFNYDAVYGRVYYTDIFGEPHSSGFINDFIYDPPRRLIAPRAYTESD